MRSILRILIVAGIFSLTAISARAAVEIVIAIRYLQAQGTSHWHLYLYRYRPGKNPSVITLRGAPQSEE